MRKSKPRVKSELPKQQYTVTLFDCNHLAHAMVLWQMQKFMFYFTVFALFYFEYYFEVQSPGGLYLEGQFNEGFFALQVWRGLYTEELIFRILRLCCTYIYFYFFTLQG